MALVSMKEILVKAKNEKYAIGQYNINNLEWTYAILEAAQETNSPVILGVSEGAAKYMGGYHTVVNMVKGLIIDLKITIPVVIHLDHGQTVESCKKAIDAGFTSVMIDASHHPILENIKIVKEVVAYAKIKNVSVEAEVGTVGGNEDGIVGGVNYAKLEECELMAQTGIDCLAAALGSVHGLYEGEPKLGFKEMAEISEKINIPLVLHGGSGILEDQIQKAIKLGHSKINVNTENQIAFTNKLRSMIDQEKEKFDPRIFLKPAREAIKETVIIKINEFGTTNKA